MTKAITLIEQLRREGDMHFGRGTRDFTADALEELIGALLSWHAAFDWAPEEVQASPLLLAAKKKSEAVVRRHGAHTATSSIHFKRYCVANIGADFQTGYPSRYER